MSDWIEGTKPKYIEARYSCYLNWDLEELGIDWDKVKDWDLCRADLKITFKDKTEKVFENWHGVDVDYKHNFEEVLILDKDWSQVEGLN